jgi:hypothetical protein
VCVEICDEGGVGGGAESGDGDEIPFVVSKGGGGEAVVDGFEEGHCFFGCRLLTFEGRHLDCFRRLCKSPTT